MRHIASNEMLLLISVCAAIMRDIFDLLRVDAMLLARRFASALCPTYAPSCTLPALSDASYY